MLRLIPLIAAGQAIDSYKDVGQAIGTLMERFGIDAIRAFATLRRYSPDRNVKLSTIARQLNQSGRLPE